MSKSSSNNQKNDKNDTPVNVHLIIQGKGGVGKSLVSTILAQYLNDSNGSLPLCIDTDPINKTFSSYKKLKAVKLELVDEEDDEINARNFDKIIELVLSENKETVIDSGSNSFIPLTSYLVSNEVFSILKSMGFNLIIHSIVAGGQPLEQTILGLGSLLKFTPENTSFVVWLNPFFGKVELNGLSFSEMKIYENNKDKIKSLINMPAMKQDTFGADMSYLVSNHLTFDEVKTNTNFSLMSKHRINVIKNDFYELLNNSKVLKKNV